MDRKLARSGFTLIEVALASVVGIILISGATLLYAQAQNQAGNARAKAKVLCMQALVETMATRNAGALPTAQGLYNAWVLERPADYNLSPWGGPCGPGWATIFAAQGFEGDHIGTGNHTPYGPSATSVGNVNFDTISSPCAITDKSTNQLVTVRSYEVSMNGPTGDGWWFVQTAP